MSGHVLTRRRGLLLLGALLGALLGFFLGTFAVDQLCPPLFISPLPSAEQLREWVEQRRASLGCRLAPWVMWASVLLCAAVGGYLAWLHARRQPATASESGDLAG